MKAASVLCLAQAQRWDTEAECLQMRLCYLLARESAAGNLAVSPGWLRSSLLEGLQVPCFIPSHIHTRFSNLPLLRCICLLGLDLHTLAYKVWNQCRVSESIYWMQVYPRSSGLLGLLATSEMRAHTVSRLRRDLRDMSELAPSTQLWLLALRCEAALPGASHRVQV